MKKVFFIFIILLSSISFSQEVDDKSLVPINAFFGVSVKNSNELNKEQDSIKTVLAKPKPLRIEVLNKSTHSKIKQNKPELKIKSKSVNNKEN